MENRTIILTRVSGHNLRHGFGSLGVLVLAMLATFESVAMTDEKILSEDKEAQQEDKSEQAQPGQLVFQERMKGNEGGAGGIGLLLNGQAYPLEQVENGDLSQLYFSIGYIQEVVIDKLKRELSHSHFGDFLRDVDSQRQSSKFGLIDDSELVLNLLALKIAEIGKVDAYLGLFIWQFFAITDFRLLSSEIFDGWNGTSLVDMENRIVLAGRLGSMVGIAKKYWLGDSEGKIQPMSAESKVLLMIHEAVFSGLSPKSMDEYILNSDQVRSVVSFIFSSNWHERDTQSLLSKFKELMPKGYFGPSFVSEGTLFSDLRIVMHDSDVRRWMDNRGMFENGSGFIDKVCVESTKPKEGRTRTDVFPRVTLNAFKFEYEPYITETGIKHRVLVPIRNSDRVSRTIVQSERLLTESTCHESMQEIIEKAKTTLVEKSFF